MFFHILIAFFAISALIENTDSNNRVGCQDEFDGLNHTFTFQSYTSITQQGMVRFIGTVTYWDYADHQRPLVWARVWVCDREPDGLDYILRERVTDMNGQFDSGWIVNNDGPGEDGLDIVFYFVAWNNAVQIVDSNGNRYLAIAGPLENRTDGQYNIGVDMPRGHGAWMIFSYHSGISGGWNYLNSSVNYEMPMATVVWPFNTGNPFYDSTNEIIFLPNWAVHPDITLHEYAHYIMNITYGYMPPALPQHSINEISNANTAWVEGWADFFPLIVQNDPVLAGWNLETQHWCSPDWDDGDLVEGRVAGALWDIYDSQNDNAPWYYDSFSNGFQHIWNIMRTTPCDTFYEFWQAWNSSGYPKQQALMAIFQNSIDYRGGGDINADGYVNAADAVILGNAFNSQKGDANFDKRADLNYDDYVNAKDSVILGSYWGNEYDC
jgi:hypothetical protein